MKTSYTPKEAAALVGKKVSIVANTVGHSCVIGDVVTITNTSGTGNNRNFRIKENNSYIRKEDFVIMPSNLASITAELKKLKGEYKDKTDALQMRVNYLKETGADELDETEFQAYGILTIIERTDDKLAKAKLISKLISG